ncbi:MAG: hypothetical protein P8144_08790 [Gammaproteobacteria bacterium]
MNVKMSSTSIVFKISEDELHTLKQHAAITQNVPLGTHTLKLKVKTVLQEEAVTIHFDWIDDSACALVLCVTSAQIQTLCQMGKSREGICVLRRDTEVFLQVDVRRDSRPIEPTFSDYNLL